MKDQLPHLSELIRALQQVPYLASKNVYRVAHHFLEMPAERLKKFLAILEVTCEVTKKCENCCAWREKEMICAWCHAPRRTQRIICVVETWHDLCAIERAGGYMGVYHVLGGVISPLDGVGPDDLTIGRLILRITSLCQEKEKEPEAMDKIELILAMNQTVEGDATAACIARKLGPLREKISISCLSRGIPVGAPLEMLDRLTIGKAIAERRPF